MRQASKRAYPIHDTTGRIVALHVREDTTEGDKQMWWERPDGTLGLNGTRLEDLPPYGSQAVKGWPEDAPVIVVEGEKPAQALLDASLNAVGTVTGAGGTPGAEALEVLRNREVVLWPDADDPGRAHMERVAERLRGVAAVVRRYKWPDAPEKGDAADHPAVLSREERRLDMLLNDLLCAPEWKPPQPETPNEENAEKEERRNQADRLIGYARASAQLFFVDENGEPHALVGSEPVPLNSRSYAWLRRLMFEREERSCTGEALKAAAGTLAAFAVFSGEVRELHTRSAFCEEAIYYELGPGRVLRIGSDGYDKVDNPPVLFRRYPNLKPLPDPEPGGNLEDVCAFVNLKTERDRRLFKTYLLTVVLPHVGRPVLNTTGPMGSGKTTLARLVKRLWDPTVPEFVRVGYRDFLQKAAHSYILALDNQSALPEEATDTLCRLVTGEADSKRRLYTDDEDVIYQLRRVVILTAINPPSDRADLLDRSLMVELERIPDDKRCSEEELWADFEAKHGKLLGAAFRILSKALAKNRPSSCLAGRAWPTGASTPPPFTRSWAGRRRKVGSRAVLGRLE